MPPTMQSPPKTVAVTIAGRGTGNKVVQRTMTRATIAKTMKNQVWEIKLKRKLRITNAMAQFVAGLL